MSNCNAQHRSTLETLPDELFFEIFEYMSITDLHPAIASLNQRFARIVRNLSNLTAVWITKFDDRMVGRFASRITHLEVWRGCELNLQRFTQLRSMQMVMPSVRQCHELRSSTLEYLHVDPSLQETEPIDRLSSLLLTNAFPRLHTCRMEEMTFGKANAGPMPALRSLATRTKDPARLLSACPLLVHLRLNLTENITPSPSSIFHLNLRHLELSINSKEITQSTVQSILSLLPNVIRFTLDVRCYLSETVDSSIRSFTATLILCLSRLRALHMSFVADYGYFNEIQVEDWKKSIEQLHPLFRQITFRPQSSSERARVVISS